ncbi:MAG: hypothetical protein JWO55_462 [Candidatus Saccharibacteria bacterium]|jgi:hypothetical protein|nr:hypothetical protein [Candidatus Saccharibacteria bacterium]
MVVVPFYIQGDYVSMAPSVTVKIAFNRPVTGVQLMDAIHQVVTRYNQEFQAVSVQQTVSQGFLIGQASSMAFKELRVSPSLENDVISTQSWYTDVIVTSHAWKILLQYALDDEEIQCEVERYILEFAKELKEVLQPSH